MIDEKLSVSPPLIDSYKDIIDGNKVVTFVNPFSYYLLKDDWFSVENIDYFYADGVLLEKLHNIFHSNKISRYSFDFSSIATNVLQYCSEKNFKVAIVGAREYEILDASENFKARYPNVQFLFRNGYFSANEEKEFFAELATFEPHLLLVGMGTPNQEHFALAYKSFLGGKLNCSIFTCGGFISQTAERPDFYFAFVKKFGLRWLQRAYYYKHVRKRLVFDYPVFLFKYIYQHLSKAIYPPKLRQ